MWRRPTETDAVRPECRDCADGLNAAAEERFVQYTVGWESPRFQDCFGLLTVASQDPHLLRLSGGSIQGWYSRDQRSRLT
jgi:hypothetical protein